MTRKDYTAIANTLNWLLIDLDLSTEKSRQSFEVAMDKFCTYFRKGNSSFDKDKFWQAVYTGIDYAPKKEET